MFILSGIMQLRPHFFKMDNTPGILLAVPILLAACASQPDVDPVLSNRMHDMFRAVYVDVDTVHINPMDMQHFTLAGLQGGRACLRIASRAEAHCGESTRIST